MLTPHEINQLENHLLEHGFISFPSIIKDIPEEKRVELATAAVKFIGLDGKSDKNADLCQLLQVLTPVECTMVCEALKANEQELLNPLIKSGQRLGFILKNLHPQQCIAVFQVFKHVLTSGREIGELLEYLDDAQYKAILPSLTGLIHTQIKDFSQYIAMMTVASAMGGEAAKHKVFDLNECLKPNLSTIIATIQDIKYASDLNRLMKFISGEDRSQVYEQYINLFVHFASSSNEDLSRVLEHLNMNECKDLCTRIQIVPTDFNPDMVLATLNPMQRTAVTEILMQKKSLLPKDGAQPEFTQTPSKLS